MDNSPEGLEFRRARLEWQRAKVRRQIRRGPPRILALSAWSYRRYVGRQQRKLEKLRQSELKLDQLRESLEPKP